MPKDVTTWLVTVGLVASLALAGCSALGGDDSCGPGEDDIDSLSAIPDEEGIVESKSVRGTVDWINETHFTVSDGTGTALVVTGSTNQHVGTGTPPERVSEGDCVTVDGLGEPLPGNEEYDGSMLAENDSITIA